MKSNLPATVCVIIGDPIEHSLSPAMHNAAYQAIGLNYIFEARRVRVNELKSFIKAYRQQALKGLSCTSPHKQSILKLLDEVDPLAQTIGAVNSVVKNGAVLTGHNTDWIGILKPLQQRIDLRNKQAVILGAGGAARAAAYALTQSQVKTFVLNRTKSSAKALAADFNITALGLEQSKILDEVDIIISALPYDVDKNFTSNFTKHIHENQIVFDLSYGHKPSKLLTEAKRQGAITIDGREMLLFQGLAQFKLFTGTNAPKEVMSLALSDSAK